MICPGAATATYRAVEQAMPEMIAQILQQVPDGLHGRPRARHRRRRVFLAGDDSRYLTGNTLFADGGGHINGVVGSRPAGRERHRLKPAAAPVGPTSVPAPGPARRGPPTRRRPGLAARCKSGDINQPHERHTTGRPRPARRTRHAPKAAKTPLSTCTAPWNPSSPRPAAPGCTANWPPVPRG